MDIYNAVSGWLSPPAPETPKDLSPKDVDSGSWVVGTWIKQGVSEALNAAAAWAGPKVRDGGFDFVAAWLKPTVQTSNLTGNQLKHVKVVTRKLSRQIASLIKNEPKIASMLMEKLPGMGKTVLSFCVSSETLEPIIEKLLEEYLIIGFNKLNGMSKERMQQLNKTDSECLNGCSSIVEGFIKGFIEENGAVLLMNMVGIPRDEIIGKDQFVEAIDNILKTDHFLLFSYRLTEELSCGLIPLFEKDVIHAKKLIEILPMEERNAAQRMVNGQQWQGFIELIVNRFLIDALIKINPNPENTNDKASLSKFIFTRLNTKVKPVEEQPNSENLEPPVVQANLSDTIFGNLDVNFVRLIGNDLLKQSINKVIEKTNVEDDDKIFDNLLVQTCRALILEGLQRIAGEENSECLFGTVIFKVLEAVNPLLLGRRAELIKVCQRYNESRILCDWLSDYGQDLRRHILKNVPEEGPLVQSNVEKLQVEFLGQFLNLPIRKAQRQKFDEALANYYDGKGIAKDQYVNTFFIKNLGLALRGQNAREISDKIAANLDRYLDGLNTQKTEILSASFKPIVEELIKLLKLDKSSKDLIQNIKNVWSNTYGSAAVVYAIDYIVDKLPKDYVQISEQLLEAYEKFMVAPEKYEAHLNVLSEILYRAQDQQENAQLPDNKFAVELLDGSQFKKVIWEDSGVNDAVEFIDGLMGIFSEKISQSIRDWINQSDQDDDYKDNPYFHLLRIVSAQPAGEGQTAADPVFAFVGEHIKTKLLKVVIGLANAHIDDIEEKENKSDFTDKTTLFGKITLTLSRFWDTHKKNIATGMKTYHSLPPEKRNEYLCKIFIPLTDDLLKLADVDLLEDIPYLPDDQKPKLLNQITKIEIPQALGSIYLGLTRWGRERVHNENVLSENSAYASATLKIFARFAVEASQSYMALNPQEVADVSLQASMNYFTDLKTPAGDRLANLIKNNPIASAKVITACLPEITQYADLWNTVESAMHPTLVKMYSNVHERIKKIEDREHDSPVFVHETAFKTLQVFDRHVRHINTVKNDHKEKFAPSVSNLKMFEGMKKEYDTDVFLANEAAKKKASNPRSKAPDPPPSVLANDRYYKAQEAVYVAEENLQKAKAKPRSSLKIKARSILGKNNNKKRVQEEIDKAQEAYNHATVQLNKVCLEEFCKPIAGKLCKLMKMYSAKDLTLPSELELLRDPSWSLFSENVMPMIVQLVHSNLSDTSTLNTIMLNTVQKMIDSMEVPEESSNDKAVRMRLNLVAEAKNLKKSSLIAKKALQMVKDGYTVVKAVSDVLTDDKFHDDDKEFFKDQMLRGHPKPYLFLRDEENTAWKEGDEVLEYWNHLISPKSLDAYKKGRINDKTEYYEAFGNMIKGGADLLPGLARSAVGVEKIRKMASETVGASYCHQVEGLTPTAIADMVMQCLATSIAENGNWNFVRGEDGKPKLTKQGTPLMSVSLQKPGIKGATADFAMPLNMLAKAQADVVNAKNRKKIARSEKRALIKAMSLQVKAIIKNSIAKVWEKFVQWVYKLIGKCFDEEAEAVANSFKKFTAFILEKVLVKIGGLVLEIVTFIARKVLEVVYFPSLTKKINENIYMDVNKVFIWDILNLVVDQLDKYDILDDQSEVSQQTA